MRAPRLNMSRNELSKSDRKWFWIVCRVSIVPVIQGLSPIQFHTDFASFPCLLNLSGPLMLPELPPIA